MSRLAVTVPELLFAAGTRALGGIGIGLLLAEHLDRRQRRALGFGLLAVGALSTIPLAAGVLPRLRSHAIAAPERRR